MFKVGDRVKIIAGPYTDRTGKIRAKAYEVGWEWIVAVEDGMSFERLHNSKELVLICPCNIKNCLKHIESKP